jgi:2'-5' RNA ligase superfamily
MSEIAPIIITAQMGKGDQAWADGLRKTHFPPERNYLLAHITLFHHLPPTHWHEIKARLAALAHDHASPPAMLSDVVLLGRGVAFRVDCPELLAMRAALAEDLHGLLIPQDQAAPRLHITVQNKVEPPVARALFAELAASFEPRSLEITGLSAYYYRGGPWQTIQRWSFSGQR